MSDILIRQRTTPTHTFELPFPTSSIAELEISYKQGGVVKFVKGKDDVTMEDNIITLVLTEEETASLKENGNVGIQVWIRDSGGLALLSDIFTTSVYPAQYKGEA